MVNSDILGALKSSVCRGYSLESAKQTLINSGYPLNEINDAVSVLQSGEQLPQTPSVQQPHQPVQFIASKPQQQIFPQKNPQKISAYENVAQKQQKNVKNQRDKIIVITLIVVLAVLLGGLIAVVLFKDQISSMFS